MEPPALRDLKYAPLAAWVETCKFEFEVMLEPPFINEAGETFKQSFRRLTSLATLPVGLVSVAMKQQLAFCHARLNLFNRIDRTEEDDQPGVSERVLAETNRLYPTLKRIPPTGMTEAQADSIRVDELVRQLEAANEAVAALYSSLILGAWTMFETLAGDLWVAALDSHPETLSNMSGSKKRISQMSREKRGAKKEKSGVQDTEPDPSISLADIHKVTKGKFDLGDKMGRLLREKYEFDSLEKTRVAYSRAFSKHGQNIDHVLSDPTLDALSAVRNVIVHRGGHADQEYRDKMQCVPGIPSLAHGERLQLDGEWVVRLVQSVPQLGAALFTGVTSWIKVH